VILTIAHVSDTHQTSSIFTSVGQVESDIVIVTGDVLDNVGRVDGLGIEPRRERRKQRSWTRKYAKKWAEAIGSRPVILVCGNHDFISPMGWLTHYGAEVHEITSSNPCVEVMGIRFAGFREINWIAGEWPGEAHDLTPCVERALACDPDILVTHSPPAGILDSRYGYGVKPLTTALAYRAHRIKAHFFGHVHEDGGKVVEVMGIYFANGAERCMVHTIEV